MGRKLTLIVVASLLFTTAIAKKPKASYVEIVTSKGTMVVKLYNETPLHRDNFLKLAKSSYYDSVIFHRVIKDFMIQGGDPDSKRPKPNAQYGEGDPGYTIPAEFNDSLYHKKGALAAARTGDNVNPKKESSGSQFYIVQGKKFTDDQLKLLETRRGKIYSDAQKEEYKSIGGTPHLDGNYTVFGELVSGIEVLDAIGNSQTLPGDRPVEDIFIVKMRVLKKWKPKK